MKVLYRAPPSGRVPIEMVSFINWVNSFVKESFLGPVHAAIAHLCFESIHPFEEGVFAPIGGGRSTRYELVL